MAFDPLRETGKLLLLLGGALLVAGLLLTLASSRGLGMPLRLGRLPGDIVYRGKNTTFYFPIVTCVLLSTALTLIFWLLSLFRR